MRTRTAARIMTPPMPAAAHTGILLRLRGGVPGRSVGGVSVRVRSAVEAAGSGAAEAPGSERGSGVEAWLGDGPLPSPARRRGAADAVGAGGSELFVSGAFGVAVLGSAAFEDGASAVRGSPPRRRAGAEDSSCGTSTSVGVGVGVGADAGASASVLGRPRLRRPESPLTNSGP
ncbi:hypothetical protein [Nesterenkonia natronophila]|uniref:hypothetical protein n=1 Tax=Nesterenkonia natronophila TaxID=2174932 RepID=UPI001CEFA224|nr:hypothetical protein [Nesterenkonia natronophila]